MRNVNLVYRPEGPGWVVNSPEAPEYVAYAGSLAEAIRLAHEGIAFHFDVEASELQMSDFVSNVSGLVASNNSTGTAGVGPSLSGAFGIALNVGEIVVPSMAPTSIRQAANVRMETVPAA